MPTYEITDPTGLTIELDGSTPPGESDIKAAFDHVNAAQSVERQAQYKQQIATSLASTDQAVKQAHEDLLKRDYHAYAQPGKDVPVGNLSAYTPDNPSLVWGEKQADRVKSFRSQWDPAPLGSQWEDPSLGTVMKTGANHFQVLAPHTPGFGENVRTAVDSTGNAIFTLSPSEAYRAADAGVKATAQAAPTAIRVGAMTAQTAFPYAAIPIGLAGETAAQTFENTAQGRPALSNLSLPRIAMAPVMNEVGGAALPSGAGVGALIGSGLKEGAGFAAGNLGTDIMQRMDQGEPLLQKGDLTTAALMGLGPAALHGVGAAGRAVAGRLPRVVAQEAAPLLRPVETPVPLGPPAPTANQLAQISDEAAIKEQIAGQLNVEYGRQSPQGAAGLREQLAREQAAAAQAAQAQKITQEALQAEQAARAPQINLQSGSADPRLLARIAAPAVGGVVGGGIGATQGDTPEERLKNAALGAGAGALAGSGLAETALRAAAPEVNAGVKSLNEAAAKVAKPDLANQVSDTASKVQGNPFAIQDANNSLTATPKLPSIAESVQQTNNLSRIADAAKAAKNKLSDVAPANFVFRDELPPGTPSQITGESFKLNEPIEGHPAGSNVSRTTLEKLGYHVPETPETKPLQKVNIPLSELDTRAAPKEVAGAPIAPQGGATEASPTGLPGVLKPLAPDTHFLYEQNYLTRNGEKTTRFYQTEGTPEYPRGRTVDEATLKAEGYDTSKLPGPDTPPGGAFGGSVGGGTSGSISKGTAIRIGSAGLGGVAGYISGDTPEEKQHNAFVGAVLGAIGGHAIYTGLENLPSLRQAKDVAPYIRQQLSHEDLPVMADTARASADKAISFASAREAAPMAADSINYQVLGKNFNEPIFDKNLGGLLVEDQLRRKRFDLENLAKTAATPEERAAFTQQAQDVGTTIGKKWSPFKTEGDFQDALADPELKAAVARHKAISQPVMEEAQIKTGGDLRNPGLNTGAFINTQSILRDEEGNIIDKSKAGTSATRGNLQNPLQRGSNLNKEFKGTAEEYETSYKALNRHGIVSNFEESRKADWYKQMQADGVGTILPSGSPNPMLGGENSVRFEIARRGVGGATENANLWVKPQISDEVRQVLNTNGRLANKPWGQKVANLAAATQLLGVTDAATHTRTLVQSITSSPGGANIIHDMARAIPGVPFLEAIGRGVTKARQVVNQDPKLLQDLAKLSDIGALRPVEKGVAKDYISVVDRTGRLILNDMFNNLVSRGQIADTDALRRAFVNQAGQYNPRLMTPFMSVMKDYQVAPFIVAGKNSNSLAARRMLPGVLLNRGIEPASTASSAYLRGQQLAGFVSTMMAVPFTVNLVTTGKVTGRTGTPLGAIDTGTDDKNGKHILIDVAELVGLRRGMRITGMNAVTEGLSEGRNVNHIGGQALSDIAGGVLSPYAGPAVQAAAVALTGHNVQGYREAKDVTPFGQTPLTLRQYKENAKASVVNLIPTVKTLVEGSHNVQKARQDNPTAEGTALDLAKSFAPLVGVKFASPTSPYRAALEQTQDTRFDQDAVNKKLIQEITDKVVSPDGKYLGAPTVRSVIMGNPDYLSAFRDDPLRRQQMENMLKTEIKSRIENRNADDRTVSKFSVEGGERAQLYVDQTKDMTPAQTLDFLKAEKAKRLLTDKVYSQYKYLKNKK